MAALNPDAKIIAYPALDGAASIDDAFGGSDKLIILYLLHSEHSGHWVCLHRDARGVIHYFDSYGRTVDEPLGSISMKKRVQLDEEQDQLHRLLDGPTVRCVYFNRKLQGATTETCGMHVSCRLNNAHLSDIEFMRMMTAASKKYGLSFDELVARCTARAGIGARASAGS